MCAKVLGAQQEETLSSEQQYMNGLGWGGEQDRGRKWRLSLSAVRVWCGHIRMTSSWPSAGI